MDAGVFKLAALAAGSLWAATFTSGVSLATGILGLFAAGATVLAVVFGVRWRIAYAVEVKAREAAVDLADLHERRANELFDRSEEILRRLDESRTALVDAQRTIARLEALPNLERVLELNEQTSSRMLSQMIEQFQRHEDNDAVRHKEMLAALERRQAA